MLQAETMREVSATLNGFKPGESMTRTAYNISEETGFQTVWAEGDVLGIYPIGGDQVSFPISNGVGSTTAKFDGGSWALRGTYKYAAYYPFSTDCYTIDQTAIPVSFLGQVQTGNNTTAHLAAYDFMAAAGTQPSANGSVNLQFNHVGCFLRMQLTMPKAGTYTSVSIQTDGGSFTTEGTVNLAATTPVLSATGTSEKLTLGLNNITTTAANQTIVLYMMIAPGNLSTHTLTFTVEDDAENTYTKTAAGKNMIATYAYDYSLTLEAPGTGGSTGGGGWGEGPTMHNGHEYVDLGLKDEQGRTIYWATCNIGADKPEEYGDYFAWGATKGYGSDDLHWSFVWGLAPFNNHSTEYDADYFYSIRNTVCPNEVLAIDYDAASQNWGGSWRMPTQNELMKLMHNCTFSNSEGGYVVTGENENSIFLPTTGYRYGNSLKNNGNSGYYWSSSIYKYNYSYYYDCAAILQTGYYASVSGEARYFGCTIRPVCVLE